MSFFHPKTHLCLRSVRILTVCGVAALAGSLWFLGLGASPGAQPEGMTDTQLKTERLRKRLRDAFSLVGQWTITKMEVIHKGLTSQPASLAQVSITMESLLGDSGSFVVGADGKIAGSGTALYHVRIAAGTTAFSGGPSTGLSLTVPIGGVAYLADSGERSFTIAGQANLEARTMKLNSFKPAGEKLRIRITPGQGQSEVDAWPPMTNVETGVIVAGASLLYRAAGVAGPFRVSFEAVKYVDLEPILTDLASLSGTPGPPGPPGPQGPPGQRGPKGDPGR